MKALAATTILSFAMLSTVTHAKQPALAPDLVIINASVHTMDEAQPTAGAVAVLGNRIVAVGATPDIRALAGAADAGD